jgi:hypothetical protein
VMPLAVLETCTAFGSWSTEAIVVIFKLMLADDNCLEVSPYCASV